MSTSVMENSSTNGETSTRESLRNNLLKKWTYLKLADQAMGMDRTNRQARLVERLVRKAQDGTIGTPEQGAGPSGVEGGEDMVRVGDENHYHYPPAPPAPPPTVATPPASGGLASFAAKAALVTAIAAGSGLGGAGLAAWMLSRPDSEKPATVESPSDVDNEYSLSISSGGEDDK